MVETITCVPRLKTKYRDEIKSRLLAGFKHQDVHQVSGLEKIIVNMGIDAVTHDHKFIEGAVRDLAIITGQRPVIDRARRSIAQFKLREGNPIGAHVILRDDRMREFLDRLLATALPRVRDFRGFPAEQLNGHGNYASGSTEQSVLHEIDQDTIDHVRGMGITVVITVTTDGEGRVLLKHLGSPFKED